MSYIPAEVRERVRQHAGNRCGYCQSEQRLIPIAFEVEHIHPVSKGGADDEMNLWLSCRMCNAFKGMQTEAVDPATNQPVLLFNPRLQNWFDHFQWNIDGARIIGQTPIGRATVHALQLNHELRLEPRRLWASVGWHPPKK